MHQKIEKLSAELHFIGAPSQNKHIVFTDSKSEAKHFSPSEYFETPEELVNRSFNRPKTHQLGEKTLMVDGGKIADVDVAALER